MPIPSNPWYEAVFVRRSRRLYRPVVPADDLLERLRRVGDGFCPFPGVRAVLVTRAADQVFKGLIGGYGRVKGAPAFIAFCGRREDPALQEKAGYLGEGIILEATALGLGTCWVGGFFRPEVAAALAATGPDEVVVAVTPIGYAAEERSTEERVMGGLARSRRRKPLEELVTGEAERNWPAWVRPALEAARLAPSALNRQPWRFTVEPDAVLVTVDSPRDTYHISKRLDCGIAMLHLELGAEKAGVTGRWELLPPPEVARFTADRILK